MKKLWLIVLLLACSVLLTLSVACGGDDDSDGSGGSNTSTSTTAATATTTPATATATADASDGGDGDADYYNQLADILNVADQQSNAIAQQYDGPYADTADEIEQTVSAFDETVAVFESVISSMGDLEPPADAEDAHNTYIANLASAAELFSVVATEFEGATTAADVTALQNLYRSDLNTAGADIEDNCLVLQDLADAASSGADLGCTVQN